jgi:hypothetical protein
MNSLRHSISTANLFHLSIPWKIGKAIPSQALRVPGGWGSQILTQSAHEGGKVVSPTHRPPLPPLNIPGTHSVRGWIDQSARVRPEGLFTETDFKWSENWNGFVKRFSFYVSFICKISLYIYIYICVCVWMGLAELNPWSIGCIFRSYRKINLHSGVREPVIVLCWHTTRRIP